MHELRVFEERPDVPMDTRGFKVPVDNQNSPPAAGEDPSHVGDRHGPSGAAFVGVEGDDPSVRRAGLNSLHDHTADTRGRPDKGTPVSAAALSISGDATRATSFRFTAAIRIIPIAVRKASVRPSTEPVAKVPRSARPSSPRTAVAPPCGTGVPTSNAVIGISGFARASS